MNKIPGLRGRLDGPFIARNIRSLTNKHRSAELGATFDAFGCLELMEQQPIAEKLRFARASRRAGGVGLAFSGHRGWLHLPSEGSQIHAGVVLCSPLGQEERNVHRALWILACELAAAGFAVLRYDHLGTAESAGIAPEGDHWMIWREGVVQASQALRSAAGVKSLVLGGIRIGATLAAQAAEAADADALLLLAPIIKGRPWLRELQFATSFVKGALDQNAAPGLEADGLWLSARAVDTISKIDLTHIQSRAGNVFMASRNAAPDGAALKNLGKDIQTHAFEEYEELFKDAYVNALPRNLFEKVLRWMEATAERWTPASPTVPLAETALPIAGGVEKPVYFGNGLHGIVCLPAGLSEPAKAVVFANTGGDPRAGIGGFAVEASRRLCASGIASLRFDFAGLGDSDYVEDWRSHIFETPRGQDYAAAIDVLNAVGCGTIIAAGVCSAGYHALRAAVLEDRIAAVYAANTEILSWRNGDTLDQPGVSDGSKQAWLTGLRRSILSPGQWRRLYGGDISWHGAMKNVVYAVRRRYLSWFDKTQTPALRANIKQLVTRGVHVRIVVGAGDCSYDELQTHFGREGKWFSRLPGMTVNVLPGLDHGLFFRESQQRVLCDLVAFAKSIAPSSVPEAVSVSTDMGRMRGSPNEPALLTQ